MTMSNEKKPFETLAALQELHAELGDTIARVTESIGSYLGPVSGAPEPHPRQPIVWVDDIIRFKENPIVRHLLNTHPDVDLNKIAVLPNVTRDDHSQFNQLIGYSVSGYGDLSCANRQHLGEADQIAEAMAKERETAGKRPK